MPTATVFSYPEALPMVVARADREVGRRPMAMAARGGADEF